MTSAGGEPKNSGDAMVLPGAGQPATPSGNRGWRFASALWAGCFSILLAGCWGFPHLWYTRQDADRGSVWFIERTNAAGWVCTRLPLDRSAEAALAADSLFYAEYRRSDQSVVRLFTARRRSENPDEIGLFVHTPDRCWTAAGWRLAKSEPEHVEVSCAGKPIGVERRLFVHSSGAQELVFFFGVVGGEGLPYRLDHNLNVARKLGASSGNRWGSAIASLVGDRLLWSRLWESFRSRRPLFGPKEFVRVSTPVEGGDWRSAEERVRKALTELLEIRPAG